MPRSKTKPVTRQHFTDAEQGAMHSMCPAWVPTPANVTLLYNLFKGRHTVEAINCEFNTFRTREIESNTRCLTDKARGPTNLNTATRAFQSSNITPLFTFTLEDTKDLLEAGMRLLKRSQQGTRNQLPSNNTSVHRHAFCELINFAKTQAGKAFQRLLDKHKFQSRITEALEALWKSQASGDRRTARQLGKNLRFAGFLNLMEADATVQGQGIEAHVDSDVAIGALVLCLSWDGWTLGLYEVDDQGQRQHVDIPVGTAVWVNGGCVHGVELNHRPEPRLTFNTFVYYAAARDTTTTELSQQESLLKLDEVNTVHKDASKAKRTDFKAALEKQGVRKSSRLE